MKDYPIDDKIRELWKKHPLRISGKSNSNCCKEPTVLVQSMEGGFVTRNCTRCGGKETLPESVFLDLDLWIACPECGKRMKATRLVYSNYGYCCEPCNISIKLSSLLPRWSDISRG